MFTDNKATIAKRCNQRNLIRRVCSGSVNHTTFFKMIEGHLLMSGYIAGNLGLLADMVATYSKRTDMPSIVLTSHAELLELLRMKRQSGEIGTMMISDYRERNYLPFYGMTAQQILQFIHLTGNDLGFSGLMDQVLSYTAAILNVVEASYDVSLPALTNLLRYDDDYISAHALQAGLSPIIADNIRANHEAGIALRRICENLEYVFEEVYSCEEETQYNFQSGALGNLSVMAFYAVASEQKLMNQYLKQELYFTLKRVPKVRVILDELDFGNSEDDELLRFLFNMKRQGKIELIYVSQNARDSVGDMNLNFSNVVLSAHEQPTAAESLSVDLWGKYMYSFPAPTTVKPPTLLPSFRAAIHWRIETEERPRVSALDLIGRPSLFKNGSDYLAIKTSANENIYLVSASDFFTVKHSLPVIT